MEKAYKIISILFVLIGGLFYCTVIVDKLTEFSQITFAILYPLSLFIWGGLIFIPGIRAFGKKDNE
jgi:hypothetical protein